MMDFKKRALILTLAATVAVTGSFAAESYKNCLMNMKFEPVNDKEISLILNTKSSYSNSITPMRKNASTYIIIMPETDNQAPSPDLTNVGGLIESVDISKMPYANGSKGYTKITIRTAGVIDLKTSTAVYIPSAKEIKAIEDRKAMEERKAAERSTVKSTASTTQATQKTTQQKQTQNKTTQPRRDSHTERRTQTQPERVTTPIRRSETVREESHEENYEKPAPESPRNNDSSYQQYLIVLMSILITMVIIYIYKRGRESMTNVMGENLKINIKDDEEDSKTRKNVKTNKNKTKSISRTTNRQDFAYKNSYQNDNNGFTAVPAAPNPEPEEEMNIVDLDALFKEKQSTETDDETTALDEFLSGFSFDEEEQEQTQEAETSLGYDEEIYESLLNDNDIKFSKEDIECFNELLQSEISDDVVKNIDKYAVSNPIKHKKLPIDKMLEKLVTDYAISQFITFTKEDVDILRKLLSVEIDPDFVRDLRTNPELTKQMEKSIAAGGTKRKPSEILTLNVKDMLPNLSDALKKQGRRPIRSEAKPEVVYYSEGYDVDKLVLDFDLPDLSKEIKNKKSYTAKPSDPGVTVDQSYTNSVQKLKTSGLPDLQDVIAHPKKYAEPKKKEYIPDEKALLNNLLNVQFKPFDDGTRKFEIINDIEEEEPQIDVNTLSTADIQNEFRQFDNFELAPQEEMSKNYIASDYDDFEALYKQDFVDLDKNQATWNTDNADIKPASEPEYEQENLAKGLDLPKIKTDNLSEGKDTLLDKVKKASEKLVPNDSERKKHIINNKNQENFEKLVDIFDKWKTEKKNQNLEIPKMKEKVKVVKKSNNEQPLVKCIMDGISYDVIESTVIDDQIGCHLVKSKKGYMVLAYKGAELSVIKEYETIKSETMRIRLSEMLEDGTPRYLIKVGANKFIADIKDGQVRYVMDLC